MAGRTATRPPSHEVKDDPAHGGPGATADGKKAA
jgi:hypothetical protein